MAAASSLVVISPSGVEADFFGTHGGLHDIDLDDDFDILVADDVHESVDPLDIAPEEVQNFILFPAGHPGYNQF
ncbi:hypothetical protein [Rhizobium sp. BK176]|uniref:hypothetical protein n=1 Tax=Rhizobium sp. BK176 TaxID=2587071 RepID=UPI002169AE47|nr:hypothetical protein [Rhizobium sp. BK176]MCS4089907.1 hypothetical protein [Rhizobium sp. BK176]